MEALGEVDVNATCCWAYCNEISGKIVMRGYFGFEVFFVATASYCCPLEDGGTS